MTTNILKQDERFVTNKSGLKPLGRSVLCVPYEPEFNKSIIQIPDHVRQLELMREPRAIVLAIGPQCWRDEKYPRAEVGDKILISRFAGAILKGPKDGLLYRMCNDADIYCGLDDGEFLDEVIIKDPKVNESKKIAEVKYGNK